jgi:hypothetical protein
MKIIQSVILALSFIIGSAYASEHEILVAENELGGKILLTYIDCPLEDSKGAKTGVILHGEAKIYGCWFYDKNTIQAFWIIQGQLVKVVYDRSLFKKEKVI